MSASPSRLRGGVRARFADDGGFTLVEVLVAFTVMAVLLSVLFRGVVGMRAGSLVFDRHTQQEIVARAELAQILIRRNVATGTYHGVHSGLRWTIVAKPVDLSGQLPPPAPGLTEQKPAGPPQVEPQAAAADAGKPAPAPKDDETKWVPQRLIVRVESTGKPLEIETIRLVKLERAP